MKLFFIGALLFTFAAAAPYDSPMDQFGSAWDDNPVEVLMMNNPCDDDVPSGHWCYDDDAGDWSRVQGSYDLYKTGVNRLYGGLDGRKKIDWDTTQGASPSLIAQVEAKTCADVDRFLTMDQNSCKQAAADLSTDFYGTGCEWMWKEGTGNTWADSAAGTQAIHTGYDSVINHASKPHGCLFIVVYGEYRKVKIYYNTANNLSAATREADGDLVDSGNNLLPGCGFDNLHAATNPIVGNGAASTNPNIKYEMKCLCLKCNRAYCNNNSPKPMFRAIPATPVNPSTDAIQIAISGLSIGYPSGTLFKYKAVNWSSGTPAWEDFQTGDGTVAGDLGTDLTMNGYRYKWYNIGQCSCDCWLQNNWFEHRCDTLNPDEFCRQQPGGPGNSYVDATEKLHVYDNRVLENSIICDYWMQMDMSQKCKRYGPRDRRCSKTTCCMDMEFTMCDKYNEKVINDATQYGGSLGSAVINGITVDYVTPPKSIQVADKKTAEDVALGKGYRHKDAWCFDTNGMVLVDGADLTKCYIDLSTDGWGKDIVSRQKDTCGKARCCMQPVEKAKCSDLDACSSTGCAAFAAGVGTTNVRYDSTAGNTNQGAFITTQGNWVLNKKARYFDSTIECQGALCTALECCVDPATLTSRQEASTKGWSAAKLALSQLVIKDDFNQDMHTLDLSATVQCQSQHKKSYWTCPPNRALKVHDVIKGAEIAAGNIRLVENGWKFYTNSATGVTLVAARHFTVQACDAGNASLIGNVNSFKAHVRCCQGDINATGVTCHAGHVTTSSTICYSATDTPKTYQEAKAICEASAGGGVTRRLCSAKELMTLCCDDQQASNPVQSPDIVTNLSSPDDTRKCFQTHTTQGTPVDMSATWKSVTQGNLFWTRHVSTPDNSSQTWTEATTSPAADHKDISDAYNLSFSDLVSQTCDGTDQDCDDKCCTRIDACAVMDLLDVMREEENAAAAAENTPTMRAYRIAVEDTHNAENKLATCEVGVSHEKKLVQLAASEPLITPHAGSKSAGAGINLMILGGALVAGLVLGLAVKFLF